MKYQYKQLTRFSKYLIARILEKYILFIAETKLHVQCIPRYEYPQLELDLYFSDSKRFHLKLMEASTIFRKALGRSAALGDLYDATADTFTGLSLLSSPVPPNLLETIENPSTKFDYLYSNRQDEKIKKCDVEAELAVSVTIIRTITKLNTLIFLQISVLCGIVSVSGQGRFITEKSETGKEISASLLYNVSTKVITLHCIHFSYLVFVKLTNKLQLALTTESENQNQIIL